MPASAAYKKEYKRDKASKEKLAMYVRAKVDNDLSNAVAHPIDLAKELKALVDAGEVELSPEVIESYMGKHLSFPFHAARIEVVHMVLDVFDKPEYIAMRAEKRLA